MIIVGTFVATVLATCVNASTQNLTTYLLTKYADTYHNVTTSPAFFHRVLNGTVNPSQVAYFFEQDIIYGRGFTTLCGNTLDLLTRDLTTPSTNRTLIAIDNLGQTASGLADEDTRLTTLRNQLQPGTASQLLAPSPETRAYIQYMRNVSTAPSTPFDAFVCSWTMGKAFVDVWTGIKNNQINKPNKIPQLQTMIDYWADPSYVAAIEATGELIDGWFGQNWPNGTDQVFLQTLEREAGFWVSVDAMADPVADPTIDPTAGSTVNPTADATGLVSGDVAADTTVDATYVVTAVYGSLFAPPAYLPTTT